MDTRMLICHSEGPDRTAFYLRHARDARYERGSILFARHDSEALSYLTDGAIEIPLAIIELTYGHCRKPETGIGTIKCIRQLRPDCFVVCMANDGQEYSDHWKSIRDAGFSGEHTPLPWLSILNREAHEGKHESWHKLGAYLKKLLRRQERLRPPSSHVLIAS